jgi:hypothetical protein
MREQEEESGNQKVAVACEINLASVEVLKTF